MTKHLTLYSTSACHLCEEAELLLTQSSVKWQTIEITDHEELLELYSHKIPVIYDSHNKKELCWPFNMADIQAFMNQ